MPIVRIGLGRRVFAPSWLMTALTLVLCVAFVRLGQWQWNKAEHRQAQWDAFARGADAVLPLGHREVAALPRFQRVAVDGRYDGAHQFLLDNRTHDGFAGYEVLTPLRLADGRVLLVDRGWVAFTGYRARLPPIALDAPAAAALTGRLDDLPAGGLAQGRAAPPPGPAWPKVTSYPGMAQLQAALGEPLQPRILLLDPAAPQGYVRDWQPPGLPPARYWSYAFQWWGFAVTLAVIWAVLSSPRRPS